MIEVQHQVTVPVPVDVVFAYLLDATNNPHWQDGTTMSTWRSIGPIRVGSVYQQRSTFLGRTIESTFEVIQLDDEGHDRRVRLRTIRSTLPIAITRRVVMTDAGRCVFREEVAADTSGLFRLAEPVLTRMAQRALAADHARLAALLEPA